MEFQGRRKLMMLDIAITIVPAAAMKFGLSLFFFPTTTIVVLAFDFLVITCTSRMIKEEEEEMFTTLPRLAVCITLTLTVAIITWIYKSIHTGSKGKRERVFYISSFDPSNAGDDNDSTAQSERHINSPGRFYDSLSFSSFLLPFSSTAMTNDNKRRWLPCESTESG